MTDKRSFFFSRPSNDFNIGLGSFSLLEEIQTGQYWANFLRPTMSDISTNQRPAEEHTGQSNIPVLARYLEDNQLSGNVDQQGKPGVMAALTKLPADLSLSETMDTSEPDGHKPRAEPMEHGQSDVMYEDIGAHIPRENDQVELHFMTFLKYDCLTHAHDGVNGK